MSSSLPAQNSLPAPPAVALTGFMAAGKSTIGRALATRLHWRFIDLDGEIEAHSHLSIRQIFNQHGEIRFRQMESEALESVLTTLKKPTVIALGGGTYVQPQNFALLRDHGVQVVFMLSAHGGLPWPWLLHAHALAACPWGAACMHAQALGACPWGAALALAAACPCLGCCMPMPWLPAHGGCLGLGCCTPWAGTGHPRGMPACTPRRIAPHRPALQQNWLVPFSIFVSLNSFHDFRGGFQQAVRRSERF